MSTIRIQEVNIRLYAAGVLLAAIGAVFLGLGGLFSFLIDVIDAPLASILAVDDPWIRFLGTRSYEIAYGGIALLCLGTLLQWDSKARQTRLESTTRFVGYDELQRRQAARR